MQIPFALQSYRSRSIPLSQQGLVNAYLEVAPEGSKTQTPILGTPGIATFTTVGNGPIRGGLQFEGAAYIVSGTELYKVNSGGTATLVGTIPGSGRVSMTAGEFLAIAANNEVYFYDGTALAKVTDPDFKGATQVAWLAGYYIYLKPGTDVFYVSAVESPNDVDALDFATAEMAPDDTVAVLVDHNDLVLFGTETTEIWGLSGAAFPLRRVANGTLEYGCIAPHSPAKLDNSVFWFANDKTVRALRGGVPQMVSTEAMATAFDGYSRVDDAIGIAYTFGGRATYSLIFPTEGKTWQFSVNTGLWNEQESYGHGRWQVDGHLVYGDQHWVWDYQNNRVGKLSFDKYDEWGEKLPFRIRSAPVTSGNKWLFHGSLYLDFETGHLTVTDAITGADRDAQVMVRWSDDARNWGDEYWRSMGRTGQYSTRVAYCQSLGRAKNRVYEVTITDPIKRHFLGAEGEITLGGY